MSLDQLTKEELSEMSLIEVAYDLLSEKKQAIPFYELLDQIAQLMDLSKEDVEDRIAQFYTDLNIDGRFLNVGGNTWGLSAWYPIEQVEDDIVPTVRAKKKKSKLKDDDDALDFDDIDDDEFDDLDDFEEDEDIDEEEDEDEFLEEDEEELDDLDDFENDEDDDDIIDGEDDLLIDDEFEDDTDDSDLDEVTDDDDEEEEK